MMLSQLRLSLGLGLETMGLGLVAMGLGVECVGLGRVLGLEALSLESKLWFSVRNRVHSPCVLHTMFDI